MKNRKILVVYNTCGLKKDNTEWYIDCVNSLLDQDFDDYRIVFSSCLNSPACFKKIYDTFGDKISYCYHSEPHTVNITFNKAVQECVKRFGEFESYLYVDSGCIFDNEKDVLSRLYESFKRDEDLKNGMISVQATTDEGLDQLGDPFIYESPEVQITGENYTIPVGRAINLHVSLYSNEILKKYGKILPDVFAAYCSESVLSFLAASIDSKWVVMADRQVKHLKSIDGATLCVPHHSPVYGNYWNNLLYGRNALDFINDEEARLSGFGYEEHQSVMNHAREAYRDGRAIYPDKLSSFIKKYLFLSKSELDYDKMKISFVA